VPHNNAGPDSLHLLRLPDADGRQFLHSAAKRYAIADAFPDSYTYSDTNAITHSNANAITNEHALPDNYTDPHALHLLRLPNTHAHGSDHRDPHADSNDSRQRNPDCLAIAHTNSNAANHRIADPHTNTSHDHSND
jgi:hypothetical protein